MAGKKAEKAKKEEAKKEESKPAEGFVEVNPEVPVEEQVPLNELPTFFPNAYEAVVAAARRARQLNLGLKPLLKTKMQRPVDIALAELAAGKVKYEFGEEEQEAKGSRKKR